MPKLGTLKELSTLLRTLKARILLASFLALTTCVGVLWMGNAITLEEAARQRTEINLLATYESAKSRLIQFHQERWSQLGIVRDDIERALAKAPATQAPTPTATPETATPDAAAPVETPAAAPPAAIDELLRARKTALGYFSELYITDATGKILHSTHAERVGATEGRRSAARAIEDGAERHLDGPYWDDLTANLGATTSSFHDGVTLMYGLPLRRGDRTIGFLHARLPADVQSDQLQADAARLYGDSGDTYLFAVKSSTGTRAGVALSRSRFEDGTLSSRPNLKAGIPTEEWGTIAVERATEFELVLADPATGTLSEGVRTIVDTGELAFTDRDGYFDYRHQPTVGVGGTFTAPGSQDTWGLITEASVDEAYAANAEAAKQFAQLAGIVIAAALTGFALFVLRPLNTLRSFVTEIRTASDSVSDTSGALGRSANSLSTSATDQAAAIAETMASMEEITAMVSSNSDAANEALGIAQSALDNAGRGSNVVAELSETMQAIAEQNGELVQVVEIIENISDKTKIINDIVFETKLLSFNASIEAARAGSQGKGFAVVAEEVGNLARLSGKAAQEIHALIEQSTKQVHNMVAVTKESISQGLSVSDRCRDAFESINEGVSKVSAMMDAIALSSTEQQQGISQVAKAMGQMDTLTQNTAVAAADAAMQSESLRDAGVDLKHVVTSLHTLVGGTKKRSAEAKAAKVDLSDDDATTEDDELDMLSGANDAEYDPEAAGMGAVPEFDDAAFK